MWVYLLYVGILKKSDICGLKVGVCIICGCALYVGIYGTHVIDAEEKARGKSC